MKKNFIIAEIGLNHLGNINILNNFLKKLNRSDIDGITLQILKKDFFIKNKIEKYYINRQVLLNNFIIKSKKKIGIIVDEVDDLILKNLNKIDFFKVPGNLFYNKKLLFDLKNTKKKIFFSNRGFEKKKNELLTSIVNQNNNFYMIHTQMKISRTSANLEFMNTLKKKIKAKKVCFGLHCEDTRILYESVLYDPSYIFFYVKDKNLKLKYLDNSYSVEFDEINFVLENLRFLNYNLKKYKVL